MESRQGQNPSANANIALVYMGLGDQDQAMIWLNKPYEKALVPGLAYPLLRLSALECLTSLADALA